MMKLARRKFLGALAASPLAAKAAAEQSSAGMMYTAVDGLSRGMLQGTPLGPSSADQGTWDGRVVATMAHLKLFGIPEHVETELRERARYVYSLDPDLAVKRSWSMSVKVAEQRQRNYIRLRAEFERAGLRVLSRQKFKAVTGFEWPL